MYQIKNRKLVHNLRFSRAHVLFFLNMVHIIIISLFLLIELNFSRHDLDLFLFGRLLLMGEIYSVSGGNWSNLS